MDLSSLEAISAEAASTPEITKMKVNPRHQRTTFLKKWQVGSDALDISEAEVVVGVGNGVEEDETMGKVKQLAKQLNASIGGSRIARYKGLVHEENQIGISGKRISALVYLALGISGAPYHIMGTKDVKHLIAVNKDKMARIFKYAEVGVVTDLRDLLPKLIELMHPEI
jgi:electron transfer flavoprotein alpha subunit